MAVGRVMRAFALIIGFEIHDLIPCQILDPENLI